MRSDIKYYITHRSLFVIEVGMKLELIKEKEELLKEKHL